MKSKLNNTIAKYEKDRDRLDAIESDTFGAVQKKLVVRAILEVLYSLRS